MQITQFVIDLAAVYWAGASDVLAIITFYFLLTGLIVNLVQFLAYHNLFTGQCSGTTTAALSGVGLLTSYLFLFVDFYIRTYKSGSKKAAAAKATKAE